MNGEKQKKRSFKARLHESLIFGFLFFISDFLHDKFRNSRLVQYFTSYGFYRRKYESSILSGLISKLKLSVSRRQKIKLAVSRSVENSRICNLYRGIVNSILTRKISYSGGGVLTFGLTAAAVYLINVFLPFCNVTLGSFVIGLMLIIASLPLIMSRQSWGSVIPKSRILGGFLCDITGFREDEIKRTHTSQSGLKRSILIGFIFGIACAFIPAMYIIAAIIGIIGVCVIIYKPEAGCFVSIGLLPFLPTMALCALTGLTAVSYILKLIRGKRTFRFEATDFMVLLFMGLTMLGGLFSLTPSASIKSAAVFICLMLSYFLVSNLITTSESVKRLAGVVTAAMLVCALYGIYQNYFGTSTQAWLDSDMFSEIETRVYSTFGNPNVFGEYLIMILPISGALLFSKNRAAGKLALLFSIGASGVALIFTWSRGAWLGFVISLILFLLLLNRRTIIAYLGGLCCLPFAIPYLPSSITGRITSIGNMADSSTSYRVSIWKAAVKMINAHPVGGIGIGESAFAAVYPNFALSGIEAAPHSHMLYLQIWVELGAVGLIVFLLAMLLIFKKAFACYRNGRGRDMKLCALAAVCGLFAILIQGFTDYVWYNYRIFALFWIICGFAVAAVRATEKEDSEVEY